MHAPMQMKYVAKSGASVVRRVGKFSFLLDCHEQTPQYLKVLIIVQTTIESERQIWYTGGELAFTEVWKKMGSSNCDTCAYNVYDEEDECYYCEVDMDEDDMVRMMEGHHKSCPYYRNGDEYAVVKKQI